MLASLGKTFELKKKKKQEHPRSSMRNAGIGLIIIFGINE